MALVSKEERHGPAAPSRIGRSVSRVVVTARR